MWVSGIKDSKYFVAIGGFRAKVNDPKALVKAVSDAAAPHAAQIVDAARVAGLDHLWMAAVNAVRSTETGLAVSKKVTVETLLYASAQDQITKALAILGVSAETTVVGLMVFAPSRNEVEKAYKRASSLLGRGDDAVLDLDRVKAVALKKAYGVGEDELSVTGGAKALGSLIVERGALLSLRR